MKKKQRIISIGKNRIKVSNLHPMVLIAGPCVIENREKTIAIAGELKDITRRLGVPFVFKASYDKANRSSINSYRGPGIEKGLDILKEVKEKFNLPILTDVHTSFEVFKAAKVADILQVPAFLCRQTDLIADCAKTGLPINIKKGQFIAPEDTRGIVAKIEAFNNKRIILTERGVTFGYHNLVVDMRSLEIMKRTGCPVIFDATHSVQLPSGLGTSSGGQREFIRPLARAATAVGIAGIFLEVHPNPAKALSDGPNSLSLKELQVVLAEALKIDALVKSFD
jgi:2-dehydro-3-deoxyphosphooctonate aldolase (KDO 8-P synthase)